MRGSAGTLSADAEELKAIFLKTYGKSKRDEALRRERLSRGKIRPARPGGNCASKIDKKR